MIWYLYLSCYFVLTISLNEKQRTFIGMLMDNEHANLNSFVIILAYTAEPVYFKVHIHAKYVNFQSLI